MHWENLDKLLAIVDREFSEQGFYHAGPAGETLSVQDGVVRTNCMDCLDRTNVVQSLLARRSMLVRWEKKQQMHMHKRGGRTFSFLRLSPEKVYLVCCQDKVQLRFSAGTVMDAQVHGR